MWFFKKRVEEKNKVRQGVKMQKHLWTKDIRQKRKIKNKKIATWQLYVTNILTGKEIIVVSISKKMLGYPPGEDEWVFKRL